MSSRTLVREDDAPGELPRRRRSPTAPDCRADSREQRLKGLLDVSARALHPGRARVAAGPVANFPHDPGNSTDIAAVAFHLSTWFDGTRGLWALASSSSGRDAPILSLPKEIVPSMGHRNSNAGGRVSFVVTEDLGAHELFNRSDKRIMPIALPLQRQNARRTCR